VATHADAASEAHIAQRFEQILARNEAKLLRITRSECFAVSSKTLAGFESFLDKLRIKCCTTSKLTCAMFPKSFFSLYDVVAKESVLCSKQRRAPVMRWNAFAQLAGSMFGGDDGLRLACDFLQRLGALIHFTSDAGDWVIVDPQWLDHVMASLVSFRTAGIIKNGILKRTDIETYKLWTSYPPELHEFLFLFLEAHSILVPLDEDEASFLAPAMLIESSTVLDAVAEQMSSSAAALIRRRYVLSFVPRDLFGRLLVRLLHCFDPAKCEWNADAFQWKGTSCGELRLSEGGLTLSVWSGQDEEAEESFALIHGQLLCTVQFWKGLKMEQILLSREGVEIPITALEFGDQELPEFRCLIDGELAELENVSQSFVRGKLTRNGTTANVVGRKIKKETYFAALAGEIDILLSIRHPNIIELAGVIQAGDSLLIVTESKPLLSSVLSRRLNFETRLQIAIEIAMALSYLHAVRPRIVHRNVCPNSILVELDEGGNLIAPTKLSGFSESTRCISHTQLEANTDFRFTAPEILNGDKHNHKADIYSFAITLWSIAVHAMPFQGLASFADSIKSGSRPPLGNLDVPQEFKQKLGELLKRCWSANAKERTEISSVATELASMSAIPLQARQPVARSLSRINSILSQHSFNEPAESILAQLYPPGIEPNAAELEMLRER
jgi:serine/threonine-protein kinase TNNI3K